MSQDIRACCDSKLSRTALLKSTDLDDDRHRSRTDRTFCLARQQSKEMHPRLNREFPVRLWCRTEKWSLQCYLWNSKWIKIITFVKISISFSLTNSSAIFASPKIWMLKAANRSNLWSSFFVAPLTRTFLRFTEKLYFFGKSQTNTWFMWHECSLCGWSLKRLSGWMSPKMGNGGYKPACGRFRTFFSPDLRRKKVSSKLINSDLFSLYLLLVLSIRMPKNSNF